MSLPDDQTAIIASVLTTLADMEPGYVAREGMAYAPFMDKGLQPFENAIALMVRCCFIKKLPNHGFTITAEGRDCAAEIERTLAKEKVTN
jgi:hypothetical protein